MKWFKFESQEDEFSEQEEEELSASESSSILVYLSPEALKYAVIVDDFESFQSSPECITGGRLLEVNRQYSYRLRQVADLVEEPMELHKLQMNAQPKREFHAEIRPEKRPEKREESTMFDDSTSSYPEVSSLDAGLSGKINQPPRQIHPEQVPFEDLESLFVK